MRTPLAERLAMLLLHALPEGWPRQRVHALLHGLARIVFLAGQRLGLHVTPNSFASPIPDTRSLPDDLWADRELPGIDLREAAQVQLLEGVGSYLAEVEWSHPLGAGYHLENPKFGTVDAHIAYALVRTHRPRRIVEVGSGWSTLLLLSALQANATEGHHGQLVACEPYPDDRLRLAAASGAITLAPEPLQAVPLSVFTTLSDGDVLFIDSSHVLKIGSDVQHALLEIVPRLAPGVLVHFHDIFLPHEYPKEWVLRQHRFYNEQYAVEAFLTYNHAFEVVWGSSYMHMRHPALLEDAIGSYGRDRHHPGSQWVRRV